MDEETATAGRCVIDCDGCVVRGDACADCVVTVMLEQRAELEPAETRALDVLAKGGLVPPLRMLPRPEAVGE